MTGARALEEIVDRDLIYLTPTGMIQSESITIQREYFWLDLDSLLSIVGNNIFYSDGDEASIDWATVTREYLEMTA